MAKLNKKPVEKKQMDRFLSDFWEAISLINSKKEVEGFFFDLLTHTERKMLAKRFQIVLKLMGGEDYPAIRSELNVGDQTIARINNWLNTGADNLIKISKRLNQRYGKKPKGELVIKRKYRGERRYLAGDLLTPAIESGLSLAAKKLHQRQEKKKSG